MRVKFNALHREQMVYDTVHQEWGTIQYIGSPKEKPCPVYVHFKGGKRRYNFPTDFDMETLVLQMPSASAPSARTKSSSESTVFTRTYTASLNREIEYLQQTGGTVYRAIDGKLIRQDETFIYAFDVDSELHFPVGTSIHIRQKGSAGINGSVLSIDDYTLQFSTSTKLDDLTSIEYTADAWHLLQALVDRLREINFAKSDLAEELAIPDSKRIDPLRPISRGQDAALLHAEREPITFIWGPPGTGKTTTLAKIAAAYLNHGLRVLIVAYSNVAVDEALHRVAQSVPDLPTGQVVRYGYVRSEVLLADTAKRRLTSYQCVLLNNPDYEHEYQSLLAEKKRTSRKSARLVDINKRLTQIRDHFREAEQELIQNACCVATTITKATVDPAIYTQTFDAVLFDEASMAYIPQVVFAASLARKHFCCFGDFRQLPSIVQSNDNLALKRDIFDYTGIQSAADKKCSHEWLVMLNVQHRMHRNIADLISAEMYGGLLETDPTNQDNLSRIAGMGPFAGQAMGLIDLSGMYTICRKTQDGSHMDLLSALITAKLAETLGLRYSTGVISPYSAQARLVQTMIRDMKEVEDQIAAMSSTVHQFQGSEMPVILYDTVDCFRLPYPGTPLTKVEGDYADRLFNVALSRAKGKVIMISNHVYFSYKRTSEKLFFMKTMAKLADTRLHGQDLLRKLYTDRHNSDFLFLDPREAYDVYLKDLNAASKSILIQIPGRIEDDDEKLSELEKTLLAALKKDDLKVQILTSEDSLLPFGSDKIESITEYTPVPLVPVTLIDDALLWYGEPLQRADFISGGQIIVTKYHTCVRFHGSLTTRFLRAALFSVRKTAGKEENDNDQ